MDIKTCLLFIIALPVIILLVIIFSPLFLLGFGSILRFFDELDSDFVLMAASMITAPIVIGFIFHFIEKRKERKIQEIQEMQETQETASIVKMHSEGESIESISKTLSKPLAEVRMRLGLPHISGIDAKVKSVFPRQNSEIKPRTAIFVTFTEYPGSVNSNIGIVWSSSHLPLLRVKIKGPFPIGELHIELDWAEGNNRYSLHYTVVDK